MNQASLIHASGFADTFGSSCPACGRRGEPAGYSPVGRSFDWARGDVLRIVCPGSTPEAEAERAQPADLGDAICHPALDEPGQVNEAAYGDFQDGPPAQLQAELDFGMIIVTVQESALRFSNGWRLQATTSSRGQIVEDICMPPPCRSRSPLTLS
jgi:hypothetical protein